MSSKVPVPVMKDFGTKKKLPPRDPRFDSLCGEFNEKVWNSLCCFCNTMIRSKKFNAWFL